MRQQDKRVSLVSAVRDDGTIIETIYRPESAKTLFAISSAGSVGLSPEWKADGIEHNPVNPLNNLLRHGALLLPSEPAEFESEEALVAEVEKYFGKYVSLSADAIRICAAYVLLSWVYDAFNELPYLRFRGEYGTGKTRALLVVGTLCYKAFFASGASTVSPIFHTLDLFKGTLVFDEADFRFSDEKAELVKIFNNGNVSGFPVLRTQVTPNREFDPRAFAIFGPKIIAMRGTYQDRALESRFLTIEMESGQAADAPLNLPDAQKTDALHLRNKLLMYRLRRRLSVAIDTALIDPDLEPRLNQILLPLLSVSPTEAHRFSIRKCANWLQERVIADRSDSAEGHILTIAIELLRSEREGLVSLAEITRAFSERYGREYDRQITNRWIGSRLRLLGIALYKSNGVFVIVPGQSDRLAVLCARYGIEGASRAE